MRSNMLASLHRALGRMEEIARKCGRRPERANAPEDAKSRFVDVLDAERKNGADAKGERRSEAARAVGDLRKIISRFADEYNIDEELVRAVIQVESGWKADAVSSKGASGLMQLMPGTARMLGVEDPFDPGQNIEGGVKYLSQLTDKYEGDVEKALAAYNAGPAKVDAAGGVPFPATERYVRNVMALYHRYREED